MYPSDQSARQPNHPPFPSAPLEPLTPTTVVRGLAGAAIGGAIGYAIFFWMAEQGFYALALPGALLGWGCSILSKRRSLTLATVCAVLALALGVVTEWRFAPFVKDESLGYFLTHMHDLKPVTLLMIGIGGALALWLSRGNGPATR